MKAHTKAGYAVDMNIKKGFDLTMVFESNKNDKEFTDHKS
jgi:hypothetical protein